MRQRIVLNSLSFIMDDKNYIWIIVTFYSVEWLNITNNLSILFYSNELIIKYKKIFF